MLPILTATRELQGQRDSDFFYCEEGEVVCLSFDCSSDTGRNPDEGCGCKRSLSGAISHKGTTTFKVTTSQHTVATFVHYYLGSKQDAGWLHADDTAAHAAFTAEAMQLLTIAAGFKIGTILERRGPVIQVRIDRRISEAMAHFQ
jgi:hypothetical protein